MIATQTGETMTIDQGMFCKECGTPVQCHVDPGPERDMIERAVRSMWESYADYEAICVTAGHSPYIFARKGDHDIGLGTVWSEVRRYWREES